MHFINAPYIRPCSVWNQPFHTMTSWYEVMYILMMFSIHMSCLFFVLNNRQAYEILLKTKI